jgi:hypothetical protein
MVIVDFIMKLIGRPPLLENGYPDMARNHRYVDYEEVARRAFTLPPPPPIAQIPTEEPSQPMVADIVNKIKKQQPRHVPSSTSSLWCGTTVTDDYSFLTKPKDPLVLDSNALKHFLVKKYPWILDVTEVRVKPLGRLTHPIYESTIVYGPLEIHITVSPTHHSELMNPDIEKKVREKLYVELISLITCMYENNNKDKPIIIFSPSHSETILEYVK